jgi:hypothetical protein
MSPTKVVVIHGRKIVVNQGIGVDAFQGAGGRDHLVIGVPINLGGGNAQYGTQAFAAGHERVGHGFAKTRRRDFRKDGRQAVIDARSLDFQILR